jgi:hypothetical protein
LPDKPSRFEEAILPHLDAAYNLVRWLMRNEDEAGIAYWAAPSVCGAELEKFAQLALDESPGPATPHG